MGGINQALVLWLLGSANGLQEQDTRRWAAHSPSVPHWEVPPLTAAVWYSSPLSYPSLAGECPSPLPLPASLHCWSQATQLAFVSFLTLVTIW